MVALDFLDDPKERRFWFIEVFALVVGYLWIQLAIATEQYLLGFLGLVILYLRFRREKEVFK